MNIAKYDLANSQANHKLVSCSRIYC